MTRIAMKHVNSTRRHRLATGLALVGACLLVNARANDIPPVTMNYQGFLVDAEGVALGRSSPAVHQVVFRLYGQATGGGSMWAEQHTVTVDKGYYSVVLGEGASVSGEGHDQLSRLFTGADAYASHIEITVLGIGPGGIDFTVQPRLQFVSSPYVWLARQAVTAAVANVTAELSHDATFADQPLPSAVNPLLIIRGQIDADGNVVHGSGFSNSTVGGGHILNFGTQFASAPMVIATLVIDNDVNITEQPIWGVANVQQGASPTTYRINTDLIRNSTVTRLPINFIAIGTRAP